MQFRSTGSRLATAVTVVLAVTALGAGTLATAPAAFAATSAPAPAEQSTAGLPVFPEDAYLRGVGTTGFLSYSFDRSGNETLSWTPYDGGTPTRIQEPEDGSVTPTGSDVVVLGDGDWESDTTPLTLRNMADPAAPGVEIDLRPLNGRHVAILSPTSVLAQVTKEDGTAELHVVTKDGAATTNRKIAGLPADATEFTSSVVHDGVVLVGYATGPQDARVGGRALIDVAAGTVSTTYSSVESGYGFTSLMFSGSHVAWLDYAYGTGLYVTSVDRETGEEKKTVLGSRADEWYHELVGGWLVYGGAETPLKAVSLTTGETRDLLDHVSGTSPSVDGSAAASGSRAADGDGLFRIAAAADGAPTVTKVADTGQVVIPLEIDQVHVPDVAELDKAPGTVTLGWTLSRADAFVDVTLTHIATGKEFRKRLEGPSAGTLFSFAWDGVIEEVDATSRVTTVDAPNGKYAVEAEATLRDGSGEPAYQGWFTNIVRKANPHDYNDNGSTDVLARDANGVLWRDDLQNHPYEGRIVTSTSTRLGAGWGVYKQIEAVGNVGGAAHGDLIAVDGSGVQWLYLGKGDGTFATRLKLSGGWQIYNKLAGGSDLDGDNRPDLVGTDSAGVMWFYKGTGSYAKPFATRVRVGGGWQIYNHVTAVGNVAGTAAGDLVARDAAGVLWLYPGNGRGNFSTRVRIGAGWGGFSQLVGAGDLDDDGRPDLIGYGANRTYVYRSTGVAATPFVRQDTDLYANRSPYNSVS
ncbi:VCBS repeat-containing protein [Streptomyces sp. NBC_00094]|uniref:FG-GAP repeat domain-containing protein n=1 Tax=Streptomyces sp. NBC_00094 TaxID=2903620 RepID=UPI00225514DE|nr:VCBS repeat-containing protein [Streptomyces sp. NBC_00094]MCX5391651.1 VCBS repeat-containing protein [Streptomyces sp. NBC_00094]